MSGSLRIEAVNFEMSSLCGHVVVCMQIVKEVIESARGVEMRIAVVHSFYRSDQPSGENQVVHQQIQALMNAGHDVRLVARYTDSQMHEPLYGVRSALRVATGQGVSALDELGDFKPDITHVHNLFPNFGSAWLDRWRGPVVTTLHNFRTVCANGLLFRDGHFCDDCPTGSSRASLTHRCYRGSFTGTLPLTIATARGVRGNRLVRRSQAVIVLSETARRIFVSFGLDESTCHVIPNGVKVPFEAARGRVHSARAAVVGRLSVEKGVLELVTRWPAGTALDVIGDGPLLSEIRAVAGPDVQVLGALRHDDVLESLRKAAALVVPSMCLEMQPTVVAEALGSGTPVIAREGNGAADIVRSHACGAVYTDKSISDALSAVFEGGDALRATSLQTYRDNFSPEAWVDKLLRLYESVLGASATQGAA